MPNIAENYFDAYWRAIKDTNIAELPVATVTVPLKAAGNLFADYFITPSNPAPPPQTTFTPAAPRSRAELTSGLWTPEDSLEFGQEETRNKILANLDRAGQADDNTPKPPNDSTYWLLTAGAVALGVAILMGRK